MSEKKHIDYFANRNISSVSYKKYKLPFYLEKELNGDVSLRILDIGCGLGQMLSALKEKGFVQLHGVDISIEAVDTCLANGLNVTRIDDIRTYCKTYMGERFDVIVMSHVLEHLPKDNIIETLHLIREYLLMPQGRFIAMVPNAQSNTHAYWAYEDFTHTTLFTAGSLFYVMKAAGYNNIEFLDPKGTAAFHPIIRFGFHFFLLLYTLNKRFWNLITLSSYHKPSPQIFTYEIKAKATC